MTNNEIADLMSNLIRHVPTQLEIALHVIETKVQFRDAGVILNKCKAAVNTAYEELGDDADVGDLLYRAQSVLRRKVNATT